VLAVLVEVQWEVQRGRRGTYAGSIDVRVLLLDEGTNSLLMKRPVG
jgi:hypothetical protein